MNQSRIVVKICGDYVAFHEMYIGVPYEFGTCNQLGVLTSMSKVVKDDKLDNIIDKINKKKQLTNKEQGLLDEIVEEYVDNYTGDYCDLTITHGYNIDGNWYINF
jgi:hypothetical protein